jgi:putative addiction module component (TIGR02574 family)
MTQEANDVLRRALALPPEDRAELAGSLLESLDVGQDPDAEAAWHEEIARRIQDLDSGKAKAIPWAEVRRRIAAKLSNGR